MSANETPQQWGVSINQIRFIMKIEKIYLEDDVVCMEVYSVHDKILLDNHSTNRKFMKDFTDDQEILNKRKEEAKQKILSFIKGKKNSYDRYNQEKAYWTMQDCLVLIEHAQNDVAINTAVKIYERFKHQL